MLRVLLGIPLIVSTLILVVEAQSFPQPNPCFRFSGQVALVGNSSLYYYGGEAQIQAGESSNLWTNALVEIDLSNSWNTGSPPIKLISADTTASGNSISSPPAVALGALWSDSLGNNLYQYGGEFSDTPSIPPPPESIWQYNIAGGNWSVVVTTGDIITRAAEGAAAFVNNIGFYFSGHIDSHTTQGWSDQTPRAYLSSLVTFDLNTHVVKNISSYGATGVSSNRSSPEINPVYRADGTLTYVPNMGTNNAGLLIAIGGATATQYVDNSFLDVFDLGNQAWTKQSTLGNIIGSRVNHCAVLASPASQNGVASSQIFVYGGQQLGNVSNRDSALYVLSLPSFTWTFIGDNLTSQPAGRAGHQCVLQGSQMVVIGGVVNGSIICDSPGIYVYDTSLTKWTNTFTSNTIYTTPSILSSSSDSSSPSNSTTSVHSPSSISSSDTSSHSSSPNIGAIVGGVVGGLSLLLLILLGLFLLRRKRRKEQEEEKAASIDKRNNAGVSRNDSDSTQGRTNEKSRPNSDQTPWRYSHASNENYFASNHASDDVEEHTRNLEMSFGSHLVPKQPLRVMNPE